MKKLFFLAFVHLLFFTSLEAQNVWDGSSISTKTLGNVGVGYSPSAVWKLRIRNTSNDVAGSMHVYNLTDVTGTKYGIYNFNSSRGVGTKYGTYNYSSFNNTGSKYGVYNRVMANGSGNTYGLYSYVAGSGTGVRYGLYSKVTGLNNYAGFFEGKVQIKNNDLELYNANTTSKVLLHNAWDAAGEAFFSIIHAEANGVYEFEKSLTFFRSGELKKEIDDPNKDAFSVDLQGNKNFVVKGSGYVYAREVEVTLDPFPDYVFSEDYDLMPLEELKTFIAENNHLPNIPSAEEVKEKGIGLGELSLKEMEKIEELTLYIIQISDRLKILEEENTALKAAVLNNK